MFTSIPMSCLRTAIRIATIAIIAAMIFARPVRAQERCDEATVRRLSPASVPDVATSDLYFNVQIGKAPVVGTAALDTLARLHGSERRNEKPHEYTILQLSTSKDASMAYDDGSVRVEFDDVATKKHVIYDLTYLRVWKVIGGKCRMAAEYGRRGDLEGKVAAK